MANEKTSSEHHRAHERVSLSIEVNLESDHNFYAGITDNISEGGLFVAMNLPPARGTIVTFELVLGEKKFSIDGEVCWVRDHRSASEGCPPGCGIRWAKLTPAALESIKAFIRSRDTIFYED